MQSTEDAHTCFKAWKSATVKSMDGRKTHKARLTQNVIQGVVSCLDTKSKRLRAHIKLAADVLKMYAALGLNKPAEQLPSSYANCVPWYLKFTVRCTSVWVHHDCDYGLRSVGSGFGICNTV